MSGWLPPGCTDKDIDDAAGCGHSPVQCDNCHAMFCPECDEDSWIGAHGSFGDCCQCGKCINEAWKEITGQCGRCGSKQPCKCAEYAHFPFSGDF